MIGNNYGDGNPINIRGGRGNTYVIGDGNAVGTKNTALGKTDAGLIPMVSPEELNGDTNMGLAVESCSGNSTSSPADDKVEKRHDEAPGGATVTNNVTNDTRNTTVINHHHHYYPQPTAVDPGKPSASDDTEVPVCDENEPITSNEPEVPVTEGDKPITPAKPEVNLVEVTQWANNIHRAIEGAGTNPDLLFDNLDRINASNILEIVKAYQDIEGTNLFWDVLDDLSGREYTDAAKIFRDALVERASGTTAEEAVRIQNQKFERELNDYYRLDDKMKTYFNAMVRAIKVAENSGS